jgi:hypothetical protein
MRSMRRIGLTMLLVVGVGAMASAPAAATRAPDVPKTTITITLVSTGEEPLASGQATVGQARFEGIRWDGTEIWTVKLTITCQGLTPGARYWTAAGSFTADRRGNGKAVGRVDAYFGYAANVDRLEADGASVTVLRDW